MTLLEVSREIREKKHINQQLLLFYPFGVRMDFILALLAWHTHYTVDRSKTRVVILDTAAQEIKAAMDIMKLPTEGILFAYILATEDIPPFVGHTFFFIPFALGIIPQLEIMVSQLSPTLILGCDQPEQLESGRLNLVATKLSTGRNNKRTVIPVLIDDPLLTVRKVDFAQQLTENIHYYTVDTKGQNMKKKIATMLEPFKDEKNKNLSVYSSSGKVTGHIKESYPNWKYYNLLSLTQRWYIQTLQEAFDERTVGAQVYKDVYVYISEKEDESLGMYSKVLYTIPASALFVTEQQFLATITTGVGRNRNINNPDVDIFKPYKLGETIRIQGKMSK